MVSKALERSISIAPPYHLFSNSIFQFSIRDKSMYWVSAQKCVAEIGQCKNLFSCALVFQKFLRILIEHTLLYNSLLLLDHF